MKIAVFLLLLPLFCSSQIDKWKNQTGGTDEILNGGCEVVVHSTPQLTIWPTTDIVYQKSGNWSDNDHTEFQIAIDQFHKSTCLRFTERITEKLYIDIGVTDKISWCGRALLCYSGRSGEIQIFPNCGFSYNFVHQLGHALCLDHEHTRPDRDNFLDIEKCHEPDMIPETSKIWTSQDSLHDYLSVMHYKCWDPCKVGTPRLNGVNYCGGSRLSVLDADKLNSLYNCGACTSHRWYLVDSDIEWDEYRMADFANEEGDYEPVYVCRGYANGQILPGRYIRTRKCCYIASEGKIHYLERHFQVLLTPYQSSYRVHYAGSSLSPATLGPYQLWMSTEADKPTEMAGEGVVPVGRDRHNGNMLLALTTWPGEEGKNISLVGSVSITNRTHGEFILDEKLEKTVTISNGESGKEIRVLRCVDYSKDLRSHSYSRERKQ